MDKKSKPINNDNVLKQKAITYFILASVLFFVFLSAFCIIVFKNQEFQFSLLISGLFIALYFAYQGYDLLNIMKNEEYIREKYLCSKIEKCGYRRQNQRVIFLHAKTKEVFVYNTTKNLSFTSGMEYEIYFKKSELKSSNTVLAVAMADRQENFKLEKEG